MGECPNSAVFAVFFYFLACHFSEFLEIQKLSVCLGGGVIRVLLLVLGYVGIHASPPAEAVSFYHVLFTGAWDFSISCIV